MDVYQEWFNISQVYQLLFTVVNKLQVEGDKKFEDLTTRQYMALMAIAHLSGGDSTMNHIAASLGVTKQNVRTLVQSLEKKGYVVSKISKVDKRASETSLTPKGKEALQECVQVSFAFFADVFADFTTEEVAVLLKSLNKLYSQGTKDENIFFKNIYSPERYVAENSEVVKEFEQKRKLANGCELD